MITWPWLMTILALISSVQWINSMTHKTNDHNSYWKENVWSSRNDNHRQKRSNMNNRNETMKTTTETSRIMVDKKIVPRNDVKDINVTLPPSNVTIDSPKNECLTNNSTRFSDSLRFPQPKSSSVVIFPNMIQENIPTTPINKLVPEPDIIDKCAMNESYCIKVDNYPRQDLLNIFRSSKFVSTTYFGIDTLSEVNEFETRLSNSNLQELCDSKEEIIFPEVGVNKNNEWRYIIQDRNDNSNYKQGIKIEKCSRVGEPCKFNDNLPIGFTTTCEQKFIYKKLVAIKDSNEIYYESFKLPSCCACMYSAIADQLTRKGEETENKRLLSSSTESSKTTKIIKTKT